MDEKFVHEVLTHQGIRALLGDEKVDAFYTAVYQDFAADPELVAVIEKYGLAQQDDYGDQMREKMTAGQKVEAGEEFVSRLAEESVKPEAERAPWYERALFKLRELLRARLPLLPHRRYRQRSVSGAGQTIPMSPYLARLLRRGCGG